MFSSRLSPLLQPFLIAGVVRSKYYLAKVDGTTQKPQGRNLSRPRPPFWGPRAAISDFAGGAALQAVSERPLRRYAGI